MPAIVDTFIAPKCHDEISMLFEDEHILVINKPTGLLSLSGKNPQNLDSVHYRIKQDFPEACMVHRLDFGTSGVMLLARNKTINALLTKQFQARTVSKTYISVLHGHLELDEGIIELPIAKDPDNFPKMKICHDEGKPAISRFKVLARCKIQNTTRVKFSPLTGRTHQLRIHSQAIGHPIVGCDIYGDKNAAKPSKRLHLHAQTLSFTHPVTDLPFVSECPCPF